LFTLAWGTGLASIFYLIGFSVEIGALVAGVILSTTSYAEEMASKMKPLRDFFVVLFFLLLGSQLSFSNFGSLILPIIVFCLFVLIGNPVIIILLMNFLGYGRRTSFMTGLALAQVSEFSLILATLGFRIGHINQETLSLITIVGLITIAGSTYMILYSEKIYTKLNEWLLFLELVAPKKSDREKKGMKFSIALFGYDRVGVDFIKAFEKIDQKYFVVDFNPESISRLAKAEIPYFYGDAGDVEFLEELPFSEIRLCVSTIPDPETNVLLIKFIKNIRPKAIMMAIASTVKEAQRLYEAGASYVVMPHYLGAIHGANLIKKYGLKNSLFTVEREEHQEYLNKRVNLTS
jgi:voltage-gated potassium channel Kch